MSNNIIAKNSDAVSYTFATDEVGGIHYQYVKPAFGPDDTATVVSTSNGLPVQPATTATWVLGAGTAAFGKLAANDGVDIGDVTLNNAAGAAAVNIQDGGNSITVDGTITASAPLVDKATFTEGTSTVMPMGGVMNDTLVGSVGEDQIAAPRITPQRALHINLRNVAGTEIGTTGNPVIIGDGSGSVTVDGAVSLAPTTSGGLLGYHVVAAANSNTANIKASAGQLYGVTAFNNSTNIAYAKLFNKASAPTTSDTPVMTFMIPASGGLVHGIENGHTFATGIAIAITNGIADNDFTAVAASSYVVNLSYK